MPSNLAADVNLGQLGACIVRVAKLDTDCSPLGGNASGWVTTGLVTMTASPEVQEGTVFEPKTACGATAYTYTRADIITRYNLTGEFTFFDAEGMEVLFGGSTILGKGGGTYAGKVIGWAAPAPTDPATNGVYLEVISQVVAEGAGDCVTAAGGYPPYVGYVFGKVKLVPGDRVFEDDAATIAFTGKAFNNPALYNGPWNDYPGTGYMKNSGYQYFGYSAAEYATILATAGAGYVDLPAGS